MLPRCVLCSSEGSRIEDIRDNVDLEGLFLADHPTLLNIPENEPLPICEDCIASKTQPNMTRDPHSHAPIGSEQLPFESESIESSSSHSSIFENMDFTIVIDSEPITQQVFESTHSEAAKKIKDVIKKPMPAQMRKRKIQEIIDAEFPNSKKKPVVKLNSREEQNNRKTYWRLVNMPGPVRRYKTSLSQSISSTYSQSSSSSTMNNSDALLSSLIPPSQTFSLVQVAQPTTRRSSTYSQSSSSSTMNNSDAIFSSLIPKSQAISLVQEPRPQIQIIPPQDLYESDDSSYSSKSLRSNSKSKDRPANVQGDGNAHSNLGAPRRIQIQSPVTAKVLSKNLGVYERKNFHSDTTKLIFIKKF